MSLYRRVVFVAFHVEVLGSGDQDYSVHDGQAQFSLESFEHEEEILNH